MSLGVSYHSTNVTLSLYKEEVITSPGYPHRDYERDTNYTWAVRADAATEEISIKITIDIHEARGFGCDDYLMVCVLKFHSKSTLKCMNYYFFLISVTNQLSKR